MAGYSQTFTVFILVSKWFRFTPPSFTSLNPLETFFRSFQPHSSSHNWGKYENSRFNSDASGYIELENAVTRNKPCTRNQVASEWVKKIFIRSWVELHFPIISYILSFNYSYRYEINLIRIMHQSIPAAPSTPPPPGLLRGIFPPCQSRGWGISKFCAARGPGICQPRGHSLAFDTHAVSYQKITTQRILLGKKADWLICQGQEKLKRFVKACSWFYACISSLLIVLELHSEIESYRRESRFLVIESNFCWDYLKNILSYL